MLADRQDPAYVLVAPHIPSRPIRRRAKVLAVLGTAFSAAAFVLWGGVHTVRQARVGTLPGEKTQGASHFSILQAVAQDQSYAPSAAEMPSTIPKVGGPGQGMYVLTLPPPLPTVSIGKTPSTTALLMFPSSPLALKAVRVQVPSTTQKLSDSDQDVENLMTPAPASTTKTPGVLAQRVDPLVNSSLPAGLISTKTLSTTQALYSPPAHGVAKTQSTQNLGRSGKGAGNLMVASSRRPALRIAKTLSTTKELPPAQSIAKRPSTTHNLDLHNHRHAHELVSSASAHDAMDRADSPCQTAQKGDTCYGHVVWVLKKGIDDHPEWYHNLSKTSSLEQVQYHLHFSDKNASCHEPCPCHTAMLGEKCYDHVSWVLTNGIRDQPAAFHGLSTASSLEDVQEFLKNSEPDLKCGQPCAPAISGLTSLFCFLVMQMHGYEPGLVKSQFGRSVGIFACDGYQVFSIDGTVSFGIGPDGHSTESHAIHQQAADGTGSWGSWLNTLTFMRAWDALLQDGRYSQHDWIVKADPDAVLIPERLRVRLKPHTTAAGANLYVQNCNQPNHIAVQGSLEVFAREAIHTYGENRERCKSQLDWHNLGEDYFMQKCMEITGVTPVQEFNIMSDVNCQQVSCNDNTRVSFHPFKSVPDWWRCWNSAAGSS